MKIKELSEAGLSRPMYHSLRDAGPDYAPGGGSQVWYWKEEYARDMLSGPKYVMEKGLFDPRDITKTHELIGTLKQTDPQQIFSMMQGEAWSPEGQARWMVEELGVGHTSMSIGDIIIIGKRALMVDTMGFVDLATGAKV